MNLKTVPIRGLCVILLCAVFSAGSAEDPSRLLDRAQALQRAGANQEAREILESLRDRDPHNIVYYARLRELLFSIQDWEAAMESIRKFKAVSPSDPSVLNDEARVLFRMGRRDEAIVLWRGIVKSRPGQAGLVQQVAGAMTAERLYEEAIGIYLEGRKTAGNPGLYALNLAGLYEVSLQYGRAAAEYLNHLKANPRQIAFVENQIRRFPKNRETVRSVEKAFASWTDGDPAARHRILGRFYLEAGLYQDALENVRLQDALSAPNERGSALFQFASLAGNAGATAEAMSAYREILRRHPDFSSGDAVWLGIGRAAEAQSDIGEAITAYESVAAHFPESRLAPEALSRKGRLELDGAGDPAAARVTFAELIRRHPRSQEAEQAPLDLAECDARSGAWTAAEAEYTRILDSPPGGFTPIQIAARTRLAALYYWGGEFERAIGTLAPFSGPGLEAPVLEHAGLNDALRIRLLIAAYRKRDADALRLFAAAEGFEYRGKTEGAIVRLDTLLTLYPDRPIAAEALYLRADLLRRRNRPGAGLADLDTLLSRFPDHLLSDRALFRSAEILESTGRIREAVGRYERLLYDHPESLLADEARVRIRAIERGRA
ncbi:MAG TPA: tetratricopeptide repeat protein [bacterium]|nr:tetratricopeptide repeat protein [bacterium]